MLKKNKVDAHAARCRNCASVSCVDCSVSFWGGKFDGHCRTICFFPMIILFSNSRFMALATGSNSNVLIKLCRKAC